MCYNVNVLYHIDDLLWGGSVMSFLSFFVMFFLPNLRVLWGAKNQIDAFKIFNYAWLLHRCIKTLLLGLPTLFRLYPCLGGPVSYAQQLRERIIGWHSAVMERRLHRMVQYLLENRPQIFFDQLFWCRFDFLCDHVFALIPMACDVTTFQFARSPVIDCGWHSGCCWCILLDKQCYDSLYWFSIACLVMCPLKHHFMRDMQYSFKNWQCRSPVIVHISVQHWPLSKAHCDLHQINMSRRLAGRPMQDCGCLDIVLAMWEGVKISSCSYSGNMA